MSAPPPRTATVFDSALLAALHALCFPDEPWSAQAMAQVLASPGVSGLIAWRGTVEAPQPVGFILYRVVADEGEVLSLGVHPAARRTGAGHVLLNAALSQARAAGAARFFLEVAEDNLAARELYARAGFRPVGRRPAYYHRAQGAAVPALILEKYFNSNEH